MASQQKRTPALAAYLKASIAEKQARTMRSTVPRVVAAVASTVPAALAGYGIGGPLPALWAGAAAFAGVTTWAVLSGSKAARLTDPKLHEGEQAAALFNTLKDQGKLYKNVDPRALMALEACAHHWHRIQQAVAAPAWQEDVPAHWEMVREQGSRAAAVAMAEALLLAKTCVGAPAASKEQDLADAIQDFVSLEIASALAGLRDMSRGGWTKYAHQSPQAPIAVPRMLEIGHDLGRLAQEVEMANARLATQGHLEEAASGRAIEMAIQELRLIQSAESEVDRLDQR